jgi:hypothetical protein
MHLYSLVKKPLTAVGIVLLALFISMGPVSLFHLGRLVIRLEMQAETKSEENHKREIFHFSAQEWKKIRLDKKEFLLRGLMYDIVSVEVKNGVVTVTALCDEEETELVARYAQSVEDGSEAKSPHTTQFQPLPLIFPGLLPRPLSVNPHSEKFMLCCPELPGPVTAASEKEIFSPPRFSRA